MPKNNPEKETLKKSPYGGFFHGKKCFLLKKKRKNFFYHTIRVSKKLCLCKKEVLLCFINLTTSFLISTNFQEIIISSGDDKIEPALLLHGLFLRAIKTLICSFSFFLSSFSSFLPVFPFSFFHSCLPALIFFFLEEKEIEKNAFVLPIPRPMVSGRRGIFVR